MKAAEMALDTLKQVLQICPHQLRLISLSLQRLHNLLLMFCTESLHCNPQLHRCIAVGGHKLVMLQFNDIALLSGNGICNLAQLSRLIRQEH